MCAPSTREEPLGPALCVDRPARRHMVAGTRGATGPAAHLGSAASQPPVALETRRGDRPSLAAVLTCLSRGLGLGLGAQSRGSRAELGLAFEKQEPQTCDCHSWGEGHGCRLHSVTLYTVTFVTCACLRSGVMCGGGGGWDSLFLNGICGHRHAYCTSPAKPS